MFPIPTSIPTPIPREGESPLWGIFDADLGRLHDLPTTISTAAIAYLPCALLKDDHVASAITFPDFVHIVCVPFPNGIGTACTSMWREIIVIVV